MPPIRQTQSYLRGLFAQRGISPQRRLGQNFLIDLNIHDLIVKTAEVSRGRRDPGGRTRGGGLDVADGGAGRDGGGRRRRPGDGETDGAKRPAGCRTSGCSISMRLPASTRSTRPCSTTCVQALAAGGGTTVQGGGEPAVSCRDSGDHQLAGSSRSSARRSSWSRFNARWPIGCALGRRATPMVRSRSWCRRWPTCRSCRALPPNVFWPQPKVDSAVVAIRPSRREASRRRRRGRVSGSGPAGFPASAQIPAARPGGDLAEEQWTKADVDRWLESQGLSGQLRAEALAVEEFVALAHALRERFGELPRSLRALWRSLKTSKTPRTSARHDRPSPVERCRGQSS